MQSLKLSAHIFYAKGTPRSTVLQPSVEKKKKKKQAAMGAAVAKIRRRERSVAGDELTGDGGWQ